MNKISDYELIKNSIDGNEESFEELLSRYKNLVFSTVYKITGDREESFDLSQEIFVKIYKNLHRYSSEHKFSTWVITIATNHTLDFCRRKKLETIPLEDSEYLMNQHTPSAEASCIDAENTASLSRAILSLPDKYLVPLVLYHREGMKYSEISEALDLPLSVVKNRMYRGRKMLREMKE